MISTLLGIKKNMTSTYDSRGRRVGATVVEMTPNFITQVKTTEGKDGYNAIQLGFGTSKSVKKPQIGHTKKSGLDQKVRYFREVKINEDPLTSLGTIQPGTEIKLDQVFSIGDAVKVSANSKGRGFAGVVKRHGFHGGPKTHGQSDRHRAPGAIGSGTTPGRVYKGKRMAGHMGTEQVSVKNLEVVKIDKINNLLTIKGAVPGPAGSLVMVTKLGRIKGYTPPPEEKPSEEEVKEESSATGGQPSDSADKPKAEEVKDQVEEAQKEGAENANK